MLAAPFVFVDIDTQRDFLEPTGALFVPGSDAIIPVLAALTRLALNHSIPILATACAHTLDEVDPEPFPPHCLVGSLGQSRVAATQHLASLTIPPHGRAPKSAAPPHLTLEKQRYDLFSHPEAEAVLNLYDPSATFVVYGVATDYCVRCAVEGLHARGRRVAVVTDAVRAVVPADEPPLLTAWAKHGILLTHSAAVASAVIAAGAAAAVD